MIDIESLKGQAAYWPLLEIKRILEDQQKRIAELEKPEEKKKPGRPKKHD